MAEYYAPNEFGPWNKSAIEKLAMGGDIDPYTGQPLMSEAQRAYWQNTLDQMNKMGADYSFQTRGLDAPLKGEGLSFGEQAVDFVTNPAVMTMLGGFGAMGAFGGAAAGAGAGAGAAEGAAATGTATGSGGALGSGIGVTAAEGGLGAGLGTTASGTGLSAGTLGLGGGSGTASGLGGAGGTGLTTGALGSGTALSPGFFASEGLAAGGGAGVGAPATGGESSLLPQGMSLTDIAMKAAPGLLGAYASDRQADAYSGLAGQYMAMGEPYRQRLSDLYTDPSSFLNSPEVQVPVQQGTNILARSLSMGGNPIGSGNALQELQNYSTNQMWNRLGQEKDRLGGFGGLTQYQSAAPGMAALGIGQQGNMWQALGGAAADVFGTGQRDKTLDDLLRTYYG